MRLEKERKQFEYEEEIRVAVEQSKQEIEEQERIAQDEMEK